MHCCFEQTLKATETVVKNIIFALHIKVPIIQLIASVTHLSAKCFLYCKCNAFIYQEQLFGHLHGLFTFIFPYCVVPENIHTFTIERILLRTSPPHSWNVANIKTTPNPFGKFKVVEVLQMLVLRPYSLLL